MPSKKPTVFRFTAEVIRPDVKGAWYFIEFPHDVQELFGTRAAVRIKGTLNGVEIDRALMPTKTGYHVIILSGGLRKQLGVDEGDPVKAEIWRNPAPEELDMPEELSETLDFLPEFNAGWKKIPIGRRRGICHWINSGKSVHTRAKRVAETLKRFEEGHEWFRVKGE
jgi:hypothetical protein